MAGVEMNEVGALELLKDIFPKYVPEFRRICPLYKEDVAQGNASFYLSMEISWR